MLLVIDDDKDIRYEIVTEWWFKRFGVPEQDVVWLTEYPAEGLSAYLLAHKDITQLSLDHDLVSTDVSSELNKEMWQNFYQFDTAFSNKTIKIHSMNARGAENIRYKLKDIASVEIVPLSTMATQI